MRDHELKSVDQDSHEGDGRLAGTRPLTRRGLLKRAAAGAVACLAAPTFAPSTGAEPKRNPLPRWRGFNLLNFFQAIGGSERNDGMIPEDDFRWICDWGFDFARIPMDYWLWVDSDWRQTRKLEPDDVFKINESMLERVDRTVELGRKHEVHVSLNFHRAPGYCINNPEREPFVLWRDPQAEAAFVHHWEVFARRYRDVPTSQLSFNLLNEAPTPREGYMSRDDYVRVMTRATEAIRAITPDRLVIVDGLNVGNKPIDELIPLGVAQSVHAYTPAGISHYRASWVDRNQSFPTPEWPLKDKSGRVTFDRAKLEAHYAPWGELVGKGVGVHCGEGGSYSRTPYDVFFAWMTDVLDILKGHGIGWALWNLRGAFGVVDSGRTDIEYEDFGGHKLDRRLLTLLQRY
jgi:endoglucanase